jgi:8-oxo-dGTP pyrophosphatase MutT (NUDIX family)
MKHKTSYGVAACRYNESRNNRIEVLMIRKRYTHHYFSFLFGQYQKDDMERLQYLFDNMSTAEKVDILSMNFNRMWYRVWLNNPYEEYNIKNTFNTYNKVNAGIYRNYTRYERYFSSCFKEADTVRNLVIGSQDSDPLWEVPKGGKEPDEPVLDCAIREFFEETGLKKEDTSLVFPSTNGVVREVIRDEYCTYENVFFVAALKNGNNVYPSIDYSSYSQLTEVDKVKWISISDIQAMDLNTENKTRLIKTFKRISSKFRSFVREAKYLYDN